MGREPPWYRDRPLGQQHFCHDEIRRELDRWRNRDRTARRWTLTLAVIFLLLLVGRSCESAAFECEVRSPLTGTVAAEVWWCHHIPPWDPTAPFWGRYVPPQAVMAGDRVTVRPQGSPVTATLGFTGAGGWPYVEVHCGIPPWVVFEDGFESGTAAAWSEVVGARTKRLVPLPRPVRVAWKRGSTS